MDVVDAIRKGVVVRYFEEKPVPEDVLETHA